MFFISTATFFISIAIFLISIGYCCNYKLATRSNISYLIYDYKTHANAEAFPAF